MKAKKTYSTRQAAAKMRVSFRTLNRWLADGKIKPSTAIEMPTAGRSGCGANGYSQRPQGEGRAKARPNQKRLSDERESGDL